MKKIFLLLTIQFFMLHTFAQVSFDTVQMTKTITTTYSYKGKSLKPKQLLFITRSNPAAYHEMKLAQNYYTIGNIAGGAGGFLIGWTLGSAASGAKPYLGLAAVGTGLALVTIPCRIAYHKQAKKAIRIYNDVSQESSSAFDLKFNFTSSGLGFKMNF